MKATRKIFATLLTLCMLMGIVSAGFTAFAAAENIFQQQLDAAIAAGDAEFNWSGADYNLPTTLYVRGDIKINFNDARITGPEGKSAIVIADGSTVELYNGYVRSVFGSYNNIELFDKIISNSVAAIKVVDGDLTANCLMAVGSWCRVPTTKGTYVPVGDAFEVYGGSTITLKKTLAMGLYAVDNNSGSTGAAHVYVEDAALVGIMGALRIRLANSGTPNRVDYFHTLGDAKVLRTANAMNEMLGDGISMSASELDLVSDFLYDNVTFVVQKPVADVSYSYHALSKDLTVVINPDVKDVDETLKNTYSYKWVPQSATVNGIDVALTDAGDGTFTAVVPNQEKDTTVDVDINYTVYTNMTTTQKADVLDLFSRFEGYLNKLPQYINKVKAEADKKIDEIQEIIDLVYETYNGPNGVLINYNNQKRPEDPAFEETALGQEFTELIGCMVALRGVELTNGGAGFFGFSTYKELYTYASNPDNKWAGIYMQGATDTIDTLNNKYGINLTYEDGDGCLTKLLEYYEEAFAIYNSNPDTLSDTVEYVADNYLAVYDLVKEFSPIFRRAYDCMTNPDGEIGQYAEALDEYTDLFLKAANALDTLTDKGDGFLASAKYTNFIAANPNFGETYGAYADKAYNVAKNIDTYFPLEVEDTWLRLVDETASTTVTIADIPFYNVKVSVVGYGAAKMNVSLNGVTMSYDVSSYRAMSVPQGAVVSLETQTYDESAPFTGFFYTLNNQWKRLTEKEDAQEYKFTAVSNMDVTMNYTLLEDAGTPTRTVTFLTDDTINYSWIYSLNSEVGEDFDMPAPLTFRGYQFTGWSATYEEILAAEDDLTVYAQYEPIAARTITVTGQKEILLNGSYISADANNQFSAVIDSVVQLNAYENNADGDVFAYWLDNATGKVLSYDKSFFFIASDDISISAVYTPEVIEAVPTIAFAGSNMGDDGKMYVSAIRSIPEGYRGVQTGIIVTKNVAYSTNETLTLTNVAGVTGVFTGKSTAYLPDGVTLIPNGTYNLGVGSKNTNPIYARAYLVYEVVATGEIVTIYDDVVVVTYP